VDESERVTGQVLVGSDPGELRRGRGDVENGPILGVERHHVLHGLGQKPVLLDARPKLLLDGLALEHVLAQQRPQLLEVTLETCDRFITSLWRRSTARTPGVGTAWTFRLAHQ
jgi:hypothetical protein